MIVFGIVFIVISAIVLINVLRPTMDNTQITVTIISFASPTIIGIFAYLKSAQAVAATVEVHSTLNSRLSEWFAQTQTASQNAQISAKVLGRVEGSQGVSPLEPQTFAPDKSSKV